MVPTRDDTISYDQPVDGPAHHPARPAGAPVPSDGERVPRTTISRLAPLNHPLLHEFKAAMNSVFLFLAALNSWGRFTARSAWTIQPVLFWKWDKWSRRAGRIFAALLFTAALAPFAETGRAAPPTNSVQVTTNYFKVSGATTREIRESMRARRPWRDTRPFDAMTDWSVRWEVRAAPAEGGFRVEAITTRATVTVTMPAWTPPAGADTNLLASWRRYFTALGAHEEGHVRLALCAAEEVRGQVAALATFPSVAALNQAVDRTANAALVSARKREAEYDRQTRHGAEQGVRLEQ